MEILIGKEITSIWAEFYWRLSTSLFMQGTQLNFMNKNLKKWKILNFLNLVLKKALKMYGKGHFVVQTMWIVKGNGYVLCLLCFRFSIWISPCHLWFCFFIFWLCFCFFLYFFQDYILRLRVSVRLVIC